MNRDGRLRQQFLAQLARQRTEMFRWLQDRGMPCPTLVVWGHNDPAAALATGMQLIELFMKKQRDTEVRIFNKSARFRHVRASGRINRLIDTSVSVHP